MALRKPSGVLRPIAVGETLRRLTSKIALELVGSKTQSVLEPVQVGVRTSHGTEGIVHAARQRVNPHSDNSNKVIVLIDIKNAFNSVDLSAVLRESFSEIVLWADLCFRSPSSLVIVDSTIDGTRGVHSRHLQGPQYFSVTFLQVSLLSASRLLWTKTKVLPASSSSQSFSPKDFPELHLELLSQLQAPWGRHWRS